MAGTFAVIGDPIDHSMSPLIHNAAFKELGMDSAYIAYRIGRSELREGVESLKSARISGFNVTIPHKVGILEYLDEYDTECSKVGAANTVSIRDGKMYGYNTDVEGFLDPLRERGANLGDLNALVLGAGGAARAVIVALAKHGAGITVANRTAESVKKISEGTGVNVAAKPLEEAPQIARNFSLIVNATPIGLKDEPSPIPAECMNKDQTVYDIVYRPMKTGLLREAAKAGAAVIYGYEMLLGQACRSFQIWHDTEAPKEVMKRAILGGF